MIGGGLLLLLAIASGALALRLAMRAPDALLPAEASVLAGPLLRLAGRAFDILAGAGVALTGIALGIDAPWTAGLGALAAIGGATVATLAHCHA